MSKTNTLTSHHSERRSNRVDKMNSRSLFKSKHNSTTSKFLKKLASKKRRSLLRQSKEEKI